MSGPDIGWQADGGPTAEQYWQSIQAYLEELRRDGYVEGAFLFQAGALSPWETFEILGTGIEGFLREDAGRGGHPGQPGGILEGGQTVAEPQFILGFKDLADRLGPGVVGVPLTDERSLKNPDGSNVITVQATAAGLFVYVEGGQPGFLPFVPEP